MRRAPGDLLRAGDAIDRMMCAESRNRMSEFFDFQRTTIALWAGGSVREEVRLRIEESDLYQNRAADLAVY